MYVVPAAHRLYVYSNCYSFPGTDVFALFFFLPHSHRLRSLLDSVFLHGLVGGRRFTGRAGEQDQVVFGLGDLWGMNKSER